jgi:hypothetical protein
MSRHTAYAVLPPSPIYIVRFGYDLYTWDAYNPAYGYWDSFSVSISKDRPYCEQNLSDPITENPDLNLIFGPWGGEAYGGGKLDETHEPTQSYIEQGFPLGTHYLNVVLDTATSPGADRSFPSWGTFSDLTVIPSNPVAPIGR